MKKIFYRICVSSIIIMMLCSLAACKKGESANNAVENENTETVVENQTQYTRDWVVMYVNEADVGTDYKKLANDKYVALNFGSKVTVKSEKTIGKKQYYKVQLPDTTEYWADKSQFAEKFIVINKEHVSTYSQPDLDYVTALKLEPGDFGFYNKEMNGWILVDFYAYRAVKEGEDPKWVGSKWIQDGWTEDITCAKQAYYLYLAIHQDLKKNDVVKALEYLNRAMEVTDNAQTEITYVIDDMKNRLSAELNEK